MSDWGCFWFGVGLAGIGAGFWFGCSEIGDAIVRTWGKK